MTIASGAPHGKLVSRGDEETRGGVADQREAAEPATPPIASYGGAAFGGTSSQGWLAGECGHPTQCHLRNRPGGGGSRASRPSAALFELLCRARCADGPFGTSAVLAA